MKLYMYCFLDFIDGFVDMFCFVFLKYNQYDIFVKFLVQYLKMLGVQVQFVICVYDLEILDDVGSCMVMGFLVKVDGCEECIVVDFKDVVFVLIGLMIEGMVYGDMDYVLVLE